MSGDGCTCGEIMLGLSRPDRSTGPGLPGPRHLLLIGFIALIESLGARPRTRSSVTYSSVPVKLVRLPEGRVMRRIPDTWWCEQHQEIHLGKIRSDFSEQHRMHLHPVYVDLNKDRLKAAKEAS